MPKQRFFLDARKLGDGGIGTFIETLLDGAVEYNTANQGSVSFDVIVSKSYLSRSSLPRSWEDSGCLNFYTDDTKKYSLSEYLAFPLRWGYLISKADLFISPHYTLPFFIKKKKMVIIHDLIQQEFPEKISHRLLPKLLIRSALKRADILATVSRHSRDRISKIFSYPEDEIKLIPNAVRNEFRNKSIDYSINKEPRFLFIGTDRLHKQLDLFLEFLLLLKKSKAEFVANIVSLPKEDTLSFIKDNDLEKNLCFYSNISNSKLADLYGSSTAYVCTSMDEGFCIPILDAMNFGIPVVCPDLDFSRELTKGNAIFFQPGSSADLYYQVTKNFDNSALVKDMIEKARTVSSEYTSLSQFEKLLQCV